MKYPAEKALSDFLKTHVQPNQRLLLGLSGGPDSLALLYMLIKYKDAHPQLNLLLELAHIDHGWRAVSRDEAIQLSQLAAQLNLPFHLKTLDPTQIVGNLENACRLERLNFFKELSDVRGCRAIILGHHADDQSETVLKRLFEGASLVNLAGLQLESEWNGMCIWRPLLAVRKKEILRWLEGHNLVPFEDQTNSDPKYLRAKMRTQLLPYLSDVFGKEVSSALWSIGEEATELNRYFAERLAPYLELAIRSSWGVLLDLSQQEALLSYELKQLLRYFFKKEGIVLSKEQIQLATEWLFSGIANRTIIGSGVTIVVDRKRLFVWRIQPYIYDAITLPLEFGTFKCGSWDVIVTPISELESHLPITGWKNVWQGHLEICLPGRAEDYVLCVPISQAQYKGGGTLDDWWTDHKIAACLRRAVPVIFNGESVVQEFLVESNAKQGKVVNGIKIVLERK